MTTKELYKKYSLNTYTRVGPVFTKGKGSFLWDDKGVRYLDLFPGWGVSVLGHCHPRIVSILGKQAKQLIHLPNNLFFKEQALLAKEIVKKSFPGKVFFANSGAEAVEGALKFSRLFGEGKKHEIICMDRSFHGRTYGALSVTGQSKYKSPFRPILPKVKEARFGDLKSFVSKVNSKTVAVILELIQGEGGVRVADLDYIQKLHNYCKKQNILFIVDEVQTGIGRTTKLFCYQNYRILPDIILLSKGLGAGFPISAMVVKQKLADIIKPGMHASTFGGSPLATRVSREVFKVIEQENLLNNTKEMGNYIFDKLKKMQKKFNFIKEIRGKGLMVGIELDIESQPIFLKCLERKMIINATQGNILRVMPALNIKSKEIDQGLNILKSVFSKI